MAQAAGEVAVGLTVSDVSITDQLYRRPSARPDYLREKLAIQDLARQMSEPPTDILTRLVSLALDMCDADSAGISILESETEEFRWFALHGALSVFEGATTPRHFSPCGICLDRLTPILMANPERVYPWIRDANIVVPEVLLVPLTVAKQPLGTLWIVADEGQKFDAGHARVLTELAGFAGLALQRIQAERKLQQALDAQEILTKEMSHRVKNVFAIADALIRTTARACETKEELAESLTGRLHALAEAHALVRRSLDADNPGKGVDFEEFIKRILSPYAIALELNGPQVTLGEHATNSFALILHELATNSVKYGAVSQGGRISIDWSIDNRLRITWAEAGGPDVTVPAKPGFGSTLVKRSLAAYGGSIDYDWRPEGMVATISVSVAKLSR
ncbi:MAG: GAF domain-containing protein [Pseudorhodoplanes sp.]|nr:GAF domain-containing protein [Pseudorhodoplanes sp.]